MRVLMILEVGVGGSSIERVGMRERDAIIWSL